MRHSRWPAVLVCLLTSMAGAQSVYRWTDASGELHYTNDRSQIPKGTKVETTEGAELAQVPAPPPVRTPANGAAAPDTSVEQANAERLWRGRFTAAHERIRQLEAEIASDQRKVDNPTLLPAARGRAAIPTMEYQRTKDRLASNRMALEEAKADLHELERCAANEAVPLEWRR